MGFVFPSLLFGFLALSIPIILYLFDLQRPKKVYFSNVRFLRQVQQSTSSMLKLRHLLILLCRLLFLSFLVLAFAQPVLSLKGNKALKGRQFVSVYVDNSYSMQTSSGGANLLENSLKSVHNLTSVFSPHTRYYFLDNGFSGKDRQPLSPEKLRDRLTEATLSHVYRSAPGIFDHQAGTLEQESRKAEKKIFWFSDFQRSTIGDLTKIQPDSQSQVYLVPMQNKEVSNVYIDSVWLENPFVRPQENNTLKVKLHNSGLEPVKGLQVKLLLNNVPFGSSTVNIAPNSFADITFGFAINTTGEIPGKLFFEHNPVNFDNAFYFTLRVSPTVHILAVSPAPNPYISGVFAGESVFTLRQNLSGNVSLADLGNADLVVVNEFDRLSKLNMENILSKVKSGATLVLFPSASPNQETLGTLSSLIGFPGLSTTKPETTARDMLISQLAPPDPKDPFFRNVFESVDKMTLMPYAFPVLQSHTGISLLETRSGKSFLKTVRSGKGHIFLCTAPLQDAYTNFQQHALFVPVMYNMAIAGNRENQQLAVSFQQPFFRIQMDSLYPIRDLELKKDAFSYRPESRFTGNDLWVEVPRVPMQPGHYRLVAGKNLIRTVAFNFGKAESEMTFYSSGALDTLFAGNPHVQVMKAGDTDQFISDFRNAHLGTPLWKYCLVTALVCLLAEVLLLRFWK